MPGPGHEIVSASRLRDESNQLQYIMHHAEDAFVFFDSTFAPLIDELAPRLPLVRGWVALCGREALPKTKRDGLLAYEDLLASASPDYAWPLLDENAVLGSTGTVAPTRWGQATRWAAATVSRGWS